MNKIKKSIRPGTLFLLGVMCILGLLSQYLIIQTETFIFDKTSYTDFSITESVTHWIVTCVLWGILGLVLFYIASRFYGCDLLKKENRPDSKGLAAAVLLLSASVGIKYLLLGGWQMAIDFSREGWFQFIFLYINKLFEASLLLLAAVFFQEAAELLHRSTPKPEDDEYPSSNKHLIIPIPWGGMVLALTWGLTHFITTGDIAMALYYTAVAFFIGCAHLAARKNIYISYAFAAILITM